MNYWLIKTEPDVFSIVDLQKKTIEPWSGVRNYQARNHMRAMKKNDWLLFYHSSCKPNGVAGLARVEREAYPDHTSWEKKNTYFDPKSSPDNPRWDMVDVRFGEIFPTFLSLDELKKVPLLKDMVLLNNTRLSVQPVEKHHFEHICQLGRRKG